MIQCRLLMAALLAACLTSSAYAQRAPVLPTFGEIIQIDPALAELIDPEAKIEVLASGFEWTEGPVWVPQQDGQGFLLFSDIPRNSVMKWEEGKGTSVYLKPSGYTGISQYGREPGSNGLLLDSEGRLVSCEHGDRRISVLTSEGGKLTLADRFEGKRLNSPNDAVYHSNGDLYFTDPPYGLPKNYDDPGRELDFCGVFRLRKTGEVDVLTTKLPRPNGIAFSPDQKILYVAQSDFEAPVLMAYPVKEDGLVGEGKVLYNFSEELKQRLPGLPDGLTVDHKGNLFVTGPGGVFVITPEGKLLGRISTGQATSNCTFGGADGSVLYMTADKYICRIQTKTKVK